MKGSSTFNLVTLYTSTWEERQNKPYKDRLKINKLLVQNKNSDLEEDNDIFEVNPSVKDLCRTLDGFVFVIDASNTDETGKLDPYDVQKLNVTHAHYNFV